MKIIQQMNQYRDYCELTRAMKSDKCFDFSPYESYNPIIHVGTAKKSHRQSAAPKVESFSYVAIVPCFGLHGIFSHSSSLPF